MARETLTRLDRPAEDIQRLIATMRRAAYHWAP